MSILGSYRLFNKLDNGSLSGAQLETLLAGSRELAEFKQLCDTTQAASALAASPTAVAAIGQSAIATQVVYDNRKNFDVVARQRLSAGSVTFLEEFLQTETLLTGFSDQTDQNIRTIIYVNGKFIGFNQALSSSAIITDGYSKYIRRAFGFNVSVRGAAYGNGVYVAVGASSVAANSTTQTNVSAYSVDGNAWIQATLSLSSTWHDVAFGNGVFVAVGFNGVNSTGSVSTSPDGVTWTSRTIADNNWRSVIFAGGQFVAVGENAVATSPDGITWTSRTIPSAYWLSVTHGNGLYVAVSSGSIATSPDGITWTSRTFPAGATTIGSVAFGGGLFVGIGSLNTQMIVSKDGVTWYGKFSNASFSGSVSKSIAYGNGMFLMTTNTAQTVQRSISSVFP